VCTAALRCARAGWVCPAGGGVHAARGVPRAAERRREGC